MRTVSLKAEVLKELCNVCGKEYLEKELRQHREELRIPTVLRCSVCNANYLSKDELWKHQNLHSLTGETGALNYDQVTVHFKLYKCLLCTEQRVHQDDQYWNHIHENHGGCSESFNSLHSLHDANVGNVSHDPAILSSTIKCECPICDDVLENMSLLSHHVEMSHGMVVCGICTLAFGNVEELHAHERTAHSKGLPIYEECEASSNVDVHQNPNISVKMEICVEEIKLQLQDTKEACEDSEFDQHKPKPKKRKIKKKSLQAKNTIKPINFKGPHQNTDQQLDSSKTFECQTCGSLFETHGRMRYHKLTTHTNPRHKCSRCPRMFHTRHVLLSHETTHLEEVNIKCNLCGETYLNEDRMQRHINMGHSLPCELCDFKFTTRIKLERHLRRQHKDSFPVDKWHRVKIHSVTKKGPAWNSDQLQDAITAVVTQRLNISQTSEQYNIPKGTLYNYILGKTDRMAPLEELVLSPEEEAAVIDFACYSTSIETNPKKAKQSLSSILEFISQFKCVQEQGDRFKKCGVPGYRWWWAFCRKHSIDCPRSRSVPRNIRNKEKGKHN